jgi:gluconate kinase
MRDRLQLNFRFDAEAMRHDLDRLEQPAWIDHFVKQNYEGNWSVLPLRAPAGAQHPIQTIYSDPSCDVFVDTPLLGQCPSFEHVLAQLHCPLHAVRLMRLTPGSVIKPHSDHDLSSEFGRVRLHIPIVTNQDVDFRLNGEQVLMREGECWYLRLSDSHSVANRGQTDRVHLVIDALLNPWLEAELLAAEESSASRPPSAGEAPAAPRKAQVSGVSGVEESPTKATSPVISDLERFRQLVLQEPLLQQRLSDVSERSAFVAQAQKLASQHGYEITLEELESAMWDRQPSAAGEAGSEPPLTGWIPFRVGADDVHPVVDWCYLGRESFTDPFFEQTVQGCRARPFNRLFARQTPIETLTGYWKNQPGIRPTAFIFHSSRCGSTLFSQLAAALPGTIAISEAPPIDEILRARASEAQRVEWLRAILSAHGQPRRGDERHFFVKFDAWHAMDLSLIRRAFPDVPFVFLYRQPAEVIASQMRMPGMQMIPGMLDPSLIGLDLPGVLRLDREEHCARVLALVYAAALTYAETGLVTLMNYRQLPEAASRQLLEWCGLTMTEEIAERLRRVTQFDAKTPSLPFDPADVSSRPAPTARAIEAALRFVTPYYEQLESMRLGAQWYADGLV